MTDEATPEESRLIGEAVARLRAGIMAIVFGSLSGTGLLVATVWLLIRGGKNTGQHLGLLSNYFPGYTVSWGGALVGLLYGALLGALVGWATAWIYNRMVDLRLSGRRPPEES